MNRNKVVARVVRAFQLMVVLLVLSGAIAGCVAKSTTVLPPSSAAVGSSGAEPVAEVVPDSEPAFDSKGGPVVATFAEGRFASVQQIDPSTGAAVTVFTYNGPADAAPSFDLAATAVHLGGWFLDQVFDRGLERMAVNWSESDGSNHVGWVDKTGALTDVTNIVSGTQSDFSAAPQHVSALFDAEGHFRYVDASAGTLNSFDVQTMKPIGKPKGSAPSIFFQPDGSQDTLTLYEQGLVKDFKMPGGLIITSYGGASIQDRIDSKRVLVRTPNGLKIMGSANLKDNGRTYDTEDGDAIAPITPSTDYRIGTATVSGDGSRTVFEGSRGDELALFVMRLDGGQPQKLMQLSGDMRLLFWR